MTLLDTSVIVDYLQRQSPSLLSTIQSCGAAICGITRAEILAGARHPHQRQRLTSLLDSLHQIELDEALWDNVGDLLATLRRAGVTVPFPDAVMSSLAISLDIELWSRDRHFPLIQQVVPAMKLFQEPP